MKCPYNNPTRETGCDLVDDPEGVKGAIAKIFCDESRCDECPLLVAALEENLKEWMQHLKKAAGEQVYARPTAAKAVKAMPGFP